MQALAPTCITADQFWNLGDLGPCELIDGEVVGMTPPDFEHGRVEGGLGERLRPFLRRTGLGKFSSGEVGIITRRNPDRVRGADAVVVLTDQLPQVPTHGYLPFVPALVVEIISFHDRWSEIHEKVEEYLAGGARLVWVLDSRRRVTHVFRPGMPESQVHSGQILSGEDVLPGLEIPVDTLFED